jgi:hypothetical protein
VKLNNKLVCRFLLAILCASLTGCGTVSRVEQLGHGYEEVAYTHTSITMEPESTQITLQYRKPNGGQVVIWPSVLGCTIKNDVAVFEAKAAAKQPDPNNSRSTDSRLFAVKAPSPPLDITDEVLWRWSKESGADFAKALKTASIAFWKEKDNMVELHFATWPPNLPDIVVRLDWNQISDIMREVKEKGVVRKDRVWGTSYIEKEFQPEVQK